jgi:hypothetical protein|tara:strand:- start:146 stop:748 length:603 start_codon:yes stop_codon:yes gene_type:complete
MMNDKNFQEFEEKVLSLQEALSEKQQETYKLLQDYCQSKKEVAVFEQQLQSALTQQFVEPSDSFDKLSSSESEDSKPKTTTRKKYNKSSKSIKRPKFIAAPSKNDAEETEGEINERPKQSSLRETILNVLERPEHQDGLKAGEICDVINEESLWVSLDKETGESREISGMISQQLYHLKKKKEIARAENGSYSLAESEVK